MEPGCALLILISPNITSIERRTVLCFTRREKYLLRPCWKPDTSQSRIIRGAVDKSVMMNLPWSTEARPNRCCHLQKPLTTAITSGLSGHRAQTPNVCDQELHLEVGLQCNLLTEKPICGSSKSDFKNITLSLANFFSCSKFVIKWHFALTFKNNKVMLSTNKTKYNCFLKNNSSIETNVSKASSK